MLEYAPKFLVGNAAAFRRLLAQIMENMLRDKHEFWARLRRSKAKEEPLPSDSVLRLDAMARTATTPSRAAARNEEAALLRLALDLLDPDDRTVLELRQYEELSFAAIGERLGLLENAARMRFQRALGRLGEELERLRSGF